MVPRASTQLSLVQAHAESQGLSVQWYDGTPHEGLGVIPGLAEADYDDANTVDYAINVLGAQTGSTFLPGVRHLSSAPTWYAPQRFFDLYPFSGYPTA